MSDASNGASLPVERNKFAVGIDLGTSFSAVAVYQENNRERKSEIVREEKTGEPVVIPSVVAFKKSTRLVGHRALDQMTTNPENTICEVKRLLGRQFNDPQVQKEAERWPFTLVNADGQPRLEVTFNNESRLYRPEQIAATLLQHLKLRTCDFVKCPPFDEISAVLTVPVNFGESQRTAIQEACQIAKIKCLQIITEPAAVALAYAWNNYLEKDEKERGGKILVFDIGGGTVDISLVQLGGNQQFDVLASVGADIGGEDFDTLLVNYCIENNNLSEEIIDDIKENKIALTRLRRVCENAKRVLSTENSVLVEFDEAHPDIPGKNKTFSAAITKQRFEELINDKAREAVSLIRKCINDAGISVNDVEKVLLAGGSSRIPFIQELIKENLPDNIKILNDLCKDEVVACGAALQAAHDNKLLDLCIVDVIPYSLGIELYDGTINRVIEKNTPIPYKATVTYHTYSNNQTSLYFNLYEGEGHHVSSNQNTKLAYMVLDKIRKAPECEVGADTTFEIDNSGLLQVTAKEQGRDNIISVRIDRYRKLLTAKAVEGLANEEEQENLQGIIHDLQEQLEGMDIEVSDQHRMGVVAQGVNRVKQWKKENPNVNKNNVGQLITNLQRDLKDTDITVTNSGVVHCPKK